MYYNLSSAFRRDPVSIEVCVTPLVFVIAIIFDVSVVSGLVDCLLGRVIAGGYYVLVEVVILEYYLLAGSPEKLRVLLNLLCVIPGSQVNMRIIEIVLANIRYKTGFDVLRLKTQPVEVAKPRMGFDLSEPIDSQSLRRLPCKALVDEVCTLLSVTFGYLPLSDHHLLVEDRVSDLLPRAAEVGTPAHHALIGNYPHREVVCGDAMILLKHDFGSHIAWSSAVLVVILRRPLSCDTEICQP